MAALDGLRILDLSQYEAGPSATQALAWLGADVVKVERPGVGDPGRFGADAPYFYQWNANKRSISVNLASPEGRDLVLRLVPRFDVFLENFGPGAIERLGLAYDDVAAVHPGIVYGSVKGFGSTGPYAEYNCFDSVAMAMAGAFSVTGVDDGPPIPPGPTMGDSGTGMQLAVGILAAYVQKLRTGVGQKVEVSMQEAMTYYLRTRLASGDWGDKVVPRAGLGRGGTQHLYPCAPGGPNDYVYVMAITEPFWQGMVRAIGMPELLTDERFAHPRDRLANADALRDIVGQWCLARPKAAVMEALAAEGVPCGMVLDSTELYTDPHLVARGFVQTIEHPTRGPVKVLGFGPRLSDSPISITPAPGLGAHTDEVLAADLGLSAAEIDALRAGGVVA